MKERIKLELDEIKVELVTFEDNQQQWETMIPSGTEEIANQIKAHIIEDQEKAKKYDDLMNANNEVVQDNISLTQIHQENKRLKGEIQEEALFGLKLSEKNLDLKTKLEKIEEFIVKENITKPAFGINFLPTDKLKAILEAENS